MLTAKEARELAGPTINDHLSYLLDEVEGAAVNGKRSVKVRKEPYNSWLYPSEPCALALHVVGELRELGYSVRQYSDGSYFGGFALEISWGE